MALNSRLLRRRIRDDSRQVDLVWGRGVVFGSRWQRAAQESLELGRKQASGFGATADMISKLVLRAPRPAIAEAAAALANATHDDARSCNV